jgi:magnesium-transporting ATPase (P-type)
MTDAAIDLENLLSEGKNN